MDEIEAARARARARALMTGEGASEPAYSGKVLPLSRDGEGNVSFDSNAGIVGSIKRAVTLPREVYDGEINPMSDEGIARSLEMATVANPRPPADPSVPLAAPAVRANKPQVPTAEALKKEAGTGYDAVRDAGVDYSSKAVADMAFGVRQALEKDGILANLAPKTHEIISQLANPPRGSVAPIQGLEAARRALGHAARDFTNPTEQKAASQAIEALTGFVERADPATVVAGPAAEAGRMLGDARGNYAAGMRSDRLTGIEEAADLRAAASHSGTNLDNTLRQRAVSLLLDPKKSAGFTDAERLALETVAKGTVTRNTARVLGNLMGGGGGLGAVVAGGVGGAMMGTGTPTLVGAAIPATGALIKKGTNAATRRSLERVDEMTRKRSPLYEQNKSTAGYTVTNPKSREALVKSLLLYGEPDDYF